MRRILVDFSPNVSCIVERITTESRSEGANIPPMAVFDNPEHRHTIATKSKSDVIYFAKKCLKIQ